MLRCFIAWNLWLAAAFAVVLGRGYARRSPDFYTVFGMGWIEPSLFWCVIIAAFALATFCFIAWRRSSPAVPHQPGPRAAPRGFDVLPPAQHDPAAT
jgi:hypothetical protein